MNTWIAGAGAAFWLGILTSISPCPLATNIAAISFISRRVANPRMALLSGGLYAAGRMLAYVLLAMILLAGLFSVPDLARWLQSYMNQLLGPLLILVGMFLLDLLALPTGRGNAWAGRLQSVAEKHNLWGAALLGFVFALSFCPVSAALFFGSLLLLVSQHGSHFVLPAIYGFGTAVPVLGFGFLIALGVGGLGKWFQRVSHFEVWARRITGGVFIVAGIYFCFRFILLA